MTLPSFIGTGGKRCGSTWLHTLLTQHPNYKDIEKLEGLLERNLDIWRLND